MTAPPPSPDENNLFIELAQELDAMETSVSAWEADFLETCLTQDFPLTAKQRDCLDKMAEKYDL